MYSSEVFPINIKDGEKTAIKRFIREERTTLPRILGGTTRPVRRKPTLQFKDLSISLKHEKRKRSTQRSNAKVRRKDRDARIYRDVRENGPREAWKTLRREESKTFVSSSLLPELQTSSSQLKHNNKSASTRQDDEEYERRLHDEYVHTVRDEKSLKTRNEILMTSISKNLPCDVFFKVRTEHYTEMALKRVSNILNKLISNLEYCAWQRWLRFVQKSRTQDLKEKMKDTRFARAARMLLDVEHRQSTKKFRRAFRHWKLMYKQVAKRDRYRAAIKIQGAWRAFHAKRRVNIFRKAGKAVRLRGVTLALRISLMERTARRRQILRIRAIELDRVRRVRFRRLHKIATRLQCAYRARLARRLAEHKRILNAAALRVQCAWRCKQGRVSTFLLRRAREERRKMEYEASVQIQRIARGLIGRNELARRAEARNQDHERLDTIQAMWRSMMRRILKSRNHEAAMKDAGEDRHARWVAMVQAKRRAALRIQTATRRLFATRFVSKRRKEWNEAAIVIQAKWKRIMKRRIFQADYIKRKAQLREQAELAQSAMIPWLNLYPDLVMERVGELLQKAPETFRFYDVSVLQRADTFFESHHKDVQCARLVQRVFRGHTAREEVCRMRAAILAARRAAEFRGACSLQCLFRGYRARRWRFLGTCQLECKPTIRSVPIALSSDMKEMCRIVKLPFELEGFNVPHVVLNTPFEKLWWSDVRPMREATRISKIWNVQTRLAKRIQRIFRGHQGRVLYLKALATHLAELATQKMHESAIKIAALTRGVLVRRTAMARKACKVVRDLNHEKYKNIMTPSIRAVLLQSSSRISFREIQTLFGVAEDWNTYAAMDEAALKVQRRFRGMRGRVDYIARRIRNAKLQRERELKAATMLQCLWRGRHARTDFAAYALRVRNERLRKQYLNEKRVEKERQNWEIHIKAEEKRQRLLRNHKRRMQKQQYEEEVLAAKLKAQHAKELLHFKQVQQSYDLDLRTLNAWRQYAEDDGKVYYYNEITGQSTYEPPPHWKYPNNSTKKLLYWKNLDDVKNHGTQTMNDEENAMCPHCNTRTAIRECNECVSRFCLSCYTKYHENDKMRHHTFKAVDTTGARFLKCVECESAPATRRCEQCEDVFCRDCYRVVHTNGQLAMHKYTEFKPGSQICVECDSDFALIDCKECGDLFCESCSKKIHAKGEMAGHSLKPLDIWVRAILGEDEEYCAECEARVATRVCDQCSDPFCDVCYENLHSKGLRKKHTWKPYGDTGLASGWQEYWDEDERKYIYFNTKTKERQTTKPIELMALAERQDAERMQREEMQKEKMESDIEALRHKLDEMNEKRKEALSKVKELELEKEKRQRIRTALKKGVRSIQTKFMFGNKRRKAEDEIEEEFLRETVIDRERTKDKYENKIMDELSENRTKLREQSYEKAKRDKKKLKREGIAGQLNDDDDGNAGPEDELFG